MTPPATSPARSHSRPAPAIIGRRERTAATSRGWAFLRRAPSCAPDPDVDRVLVDAAQGGSEEAFCELVDRYSGEMLRFARCYVPDPSLAAEVVRDAWIEVLGLLARGEGDVVFKTLLFRVLRRIASGRRKGENRGEPFSSWVMPNGPGGGAESPFAPPGGVRAGSWAAPIAPWSSEDAQRLGSPSARAVIEAAIASLPDMQRQVITLRDIESWSAGEVADVLGVTEGGQRLLLHRARSKVRAALDAYLRQVPA